MVVHLPDWNNPYNDLSLDRIKRIVDLAERLDINIAMENVRNYPSLTYVLDHIDSDRIYGTGTYELGLYESNDGRVPKKGV